jgi:hypothetical protein
MVFYDICTRNVSELLAWKRVAFVVLNILSLFIPNSKIPLLHVNMNLFQRKPGQSLWPMIYIFIAKAVLLVSLVWVGGRSGGGGDMVIE